MKMRQSTWVSTIKRSWLQQSGVVKKYLPFNWADIFAMIFLLEHAAHCMLTNNSISTTWAGIRLFSCSCAAPKPSIKNIYKTDYKIVTDGPDHIFNIAIGSFLPLRIYLDCIRLLKLCIAQIASTCVDDCDMW